MRHVLFGILTLGGGLLLAALPATGWSAVPTGGQAGKGLFDRQIEGSEASAMMSVYGRARNAVTASDRPRVTANDRTVGGRRFQVETSLDYQAETSAVPTNRTFAFPTRVRYGIVDSLEVQAQGNLLTFNTTTGRGTATGFGDLFFGTKWAIVDGGGVLPSLGMAAQLGVPTGSSNVSNNALVPQANAIFAWELPWELTLDSNLGLDVPPKDAAGDRFTRMVYGLALERNLPVLDDRLHAFLEFAGRTPIKAGKTGPHQFGAGLGFRLSKQMQLDTFARAGLSSPAPNLQTGVGFSWRP